MMDFLNSLSPCQVVVYGVWLPSLILAIIGKTEFSLMDWYGRWQRSRRRKARR